jgi:U3 small nucleolar RNA-associated protein MPP10
MLNNLDGKPWQLKGEVTAKSRPKESLMEEFLEFDHTNRQAPIIDASYTEKLEKIIKQRIKDKAFDDVERKLKPVEMQYEYKKQVVLDQEKSKLGLGDVYEQEYLKQQQKQQSETAVDVRLVFYLKKNQLTCSKMK